MRKLIIEITEDDMGSIKIERTVPDGSQPFNNAEEVGLLTTYIQNKITITAAQVPINGAQG